MTFIVTLLALAAIGAATVITLPTMLICYLVGKVWRRWRSAKKVARELFALETGTCDGLPAEQIQRLVEESWDPSLHC
ncbi:MAG: hypothetical protein ACTHOG_12825 [Marmoricola sp.]